jgi:hypothetical protein
MALFSETGDRQATRISYGPGVRLSPHPPTASDSAKTSESARFLRLPQRATQRPECRCPCDGRLDLLKGPGQDGCDFGVQCVLSLDSLGCVTCLCGHVSACLRVCVSVCTGVDESSGQKVPPRRRQMWLKSQLARPRGHGAIVTLLRPACT